MKNARPLLLNPWSAWLICSVGLAISFGSVVAGAQSAGNNLTGEVELGVGYLDDSSFKFGEYTGLVNEGAFFIGNIGIGGKNNYDAGSSEYWKLDAYRLGLDSRSIYGEYGQQGNFSVHLSYDQTPHYRFDDASTPFIGAGTNSQILPDNWIASNTTEGMSNLVSNLQTYSVSTERKEVATGFSWLLDKKWELTGEISRELKDGTEPIGAIFGTNGGNPRGAILLQPVDYETDEYQIALGYTDRKLQFSAGYSLSQFTNNESLLRWDNPFLRLPVGNTWAPGTGFDSGARGQLALVPDNQAQHININGGYNLGKSTRITGNLTYGKMTQDDAFLSYTINPNLAVPSGLPGNSLDAEIETLYLRLGFSTRPSRKIDIRGQYIYDDRDNNTPRDIYQLVINDSGNQGSLLSSGARINTPYSFRKQKLLLEAGFRISSRSKLSIGYEFDERDRDYSEVDSTKEHTGRIKFRSSLGAAVNGWIEYERSERDGSGYISNQPFLDAHNPDYIATLAEEERYINDPLLRKYPYADRERDKIHGAINLAPVSSLSFSISGRYNKNKYSESILGLQESTDAAITFDLAWMVSTGLEAYAYLTREQTEYKQAGYQRAATELFPGISRDPPPCATCGFWNVDMDDDINTLGAGLDWDVFENKLDLKLDYTYSDTDTRFSPRGDGNLAIAPISDVTSRLHSLSLTGNYRLGDRTSIRLRYVYQRFRLEDFAEEGVTPNTLRNIISTGNGNPDYSVHVIGLSMVSGF